MQYKWTVFTVTSVGVIMSGIDSRIIIIGLPSVASALHADAEQAVWFTQAYVLGSTLAMLLIGRTADIIGRVKLYTAGFVVFTLGSLLVSLSQVPNEVVAFRALQGIGSAMLTVNSTALLVDAVEEKNLGMMLGLNTLAFRTGTLIALTLSGVLLSFYDWRFLFYINIPIGVFGTYWARRRLRETKPKGPRQRMDWVGFATFATSIGALLLGMTYAAYGFASESVTASIFAISVVTFVAFVYQERRTPEPLLDLTLFRIRQFSGGSAALLLNATAWGAVLVLMSLYFQLGLGWSPLQAGLAFLPFEFSFIALSPLSGKLSDTHGRNRFMMLGLAVEGVAVFLFSTLTTASSFLYVALPLVLFGAGCGMFNSPVTSSTMSAVPPERRGIASATTNVIWYVGYVLSLNLAILLMTTVLPFSEVSATIASIGSTATVNRALFVEGLSRAFLILSIIQFIGIIPSSLRGDWRTTSGAWQSSESRSSTETPILE
ncbi:MAG: MFS transporter [Thaumarchaeota archaeon]|nr:MFS transporter [Nitrososphaerota archaeon]